MGLLDDAIREHLDLKRRRGADPTEVEREEREVLGPVRRRGRGAEPDDLDLEDSLVDVDEPFDEDEDIGWANGGTGAPEPSPASAAFDHEQLAEPALGPDLEGHYEPEPEPEPYLHRRPDPPYEEPRHDREPYRPAPEDPAAGHDTGYEAPDPGQSTVEFNVEEANADDAEEDVLEETPEFLQDTPEHDRLWFEQRPPRDFDFDG